MWSGFVGRALASALHLTPFLWGCCAPNPMWLRPCQCMGKAFLNYWAFLTYSLCSPLSGLPKGSAFAVGWIEDHGVVASA